MAFDTSVGLSDQIRDYFADFLGRTLPQGDQISTACPFHDDDDPSFSMNLNTGLWTCHAGCGKGNFDQFRDRCEGELSEVAIGKQIAAASGATETIYPYCDESGRELYEVVRLDSDGNKTFKCRVRLPDGTYRNKLSGVRRVPYRLPELMDADLVIICEGEQCVDAVRALRLSELAGMRVTATCNSHGAGKWRPEYNGHFDGKQVVLLPDNDAPGGEHMNTVARNLSTHAREIKMLALPDLPDHGDIVDFIATHGDNAAQELLRAIERTPVIERGNTTSPAVLTVSELLAQSGEHLNWLVGDLLLECGLSIVVAKPKVAKSTLVRNLALSVARGEPFLERETKQGPVIYVSLEDSVAIVRDHIRRLGVTNADPIFFRIDRLSKAELQTLIRKHEPILVIIDSLYRYADIKKVDDYVENTQALASLQELCREYRVHVCVTHHLGKSTRDDEFDSILGSTAIFGTVETAIALKRDPKTNIRTVCTRSRRAVDLDETVLDFDAETGRLTLGESLSGIKAASKRDEVVSRENRILEFLSKAGSATEADIKSAVPGKAENIRVELASLVQSGVIQKTGAGVRGDPFRYTAALILEAPNVEVSVIEPVPI